LNKVKTIILNKQTIPNNRTKIQELKLNTETKTPAKETRKIDLLKQVNKATPLR
jgi:hypothetical protein